MQSSDNPPSPIVCPDGINGKSRAAFEAAIRLARGGVSVLPIMADGTKAPALDEWEPLQERLATEDELAEWFGCGRLMGLATIGGKVSGGLEQIDFDRNASVIFASWSELVEAEQPGLVARLSIVQTPRDPAGYHVRYRCPEASIPGNTKLAVDPAAPPNDRVLIETRGEGGYALAPGCPAECHASGRLYRRLSGPMIPPTISQAERVCLIRCAMSFDLSLTKSPNPSALAVATPSGNDGDLRPGDDFDLRGWDWAQILEPHGWKLSHSGKEGVRYWRRPGKTDPGWSATTGKCRGSQGEELLRVFSSNAHPFEDGHAYGRFRAYTLLHHNGDYSSAAMALSRLGFGSGGGTARVKIGSLREPAEVVEAEGYHLTDLGNAKRVAAAHGDEMRFSHAQKTWYIWLGRLWKGDDSGESVRRVKFTQSDFFEANHQALHTELDKAKRGKLMQALSHALKWEDARAIQRTLKLLESEPGIPIAIEEMDRDPMLLNVLNGTIDLRTGKIRAHDPLDFITKLAPVTYDPHATCPTWEKCLSDWMLGKQSLIDYLRRVIGYSLTADVREQALFFLWGEGANGKSTFVNLVRDMLGDYALKAVNDLLLQKRSDSHSTERADLFGKRFVLTSETDEGRRMAEALMKDMTGGEKLRARKMRQDNYEFAPTWKLFLSSNHKPNIQGQDLGVWRRIRLIPWLACFKGSQKDASLADKLKAEMPGIMAWAVRGCLEWQQRGLADPPEVIEATAAYQKDQDSVAAFIAECCTVAEFAKANSSALLKAYQEFTGNKSISRQTFQKRLSEKGYRSRRGTGGAYIYEGIGLDADNFEDNESRFV